MIYKVMMREAEATAKRSQDTTMVGAVISYGETYISSGFNALPTGIARLPERVVRPAKYQYTIHAEVSAVARAARSGSSTQSCAMYLSNGTPCTECAKIIIGAGITDLVVFNRPFSGSLWWKDSCDFGMLLLLESGVVVHRLDDDYREIV